MKLKMRPRFRTASLLWLVVVVAAFFVGRQSDEIYLRLCQQWSALWPNSASYHLNKQPDGSLLLTLKWPPVTQCVFSGKACSLTGNTKLTPERDGTTEIKISQNDGSQVQIVLEVKVLKFNSIQQYRILAASTATAPLPAK